MKEDRKTWLIRFETSSGPVTHLMVDASEEAQRAELDRIWNGILKWGVCHGAVRVDARKLLLDFGAQLVPEVKR